MPLLMLYGEGKKAFHRLQLEIIRLSNDQSIFACQGCNEGDVHGVFKEVGKSKPAEPESFTEEEYKRHDNQKVNFIVYPPSCVRPVLHLYG